MFLAGLCADVEHLHWVQTLRDAHMVIDARLQWDCKAVGKPRPTYKWLKNGQPLTAEVSRDKEHFNFVVHEIKCKEKKNVFLPEATLQAAPSEVIL